MEQQITPKVPFKTNLETELNYYYMEKIKKYDKERKHIPESVIIEFKKHVEEIRKENPIYKEKI